MTDPLTEQQRQRLAALYGTQGALHIELDGYDLIRCAHWVATGRELPTDGPESTTAVHISPDAATWSSAQN